MLNARRKACKFTNRKLLELSKFPVAFNCLDDNFMEQQFELRKQTIHHLELISSDV